MRIFRFYVESLRKSWMSRLGRYLWAIILIKLIIMFVFLKLFFFPDILKKNFHNDKERSLHVIEVLTGSK